MIEIDALVVGAGVVGLATARAFQNAGFETVLIDRESSFGTQTSSRSSEVIHAGIYYAAGSLKAKYCVDGKEKLYAYCRSKGVPHKNLGKLIVAGSDADIPVLEKYLAQAEENGVHDLEWRDKAAVHGLEPAIRPAVALFSPSTGIIDSHAYMLSLLHDFEMADGVFLRRTAFVWAEVASERLNVLLDDQTKISVRWLVNAGGLDAPVIAERIHGLNRDYVPRPHYAIGHYYALKGQSPFNRLIYPIAEAGGLGVHVTLDMDGRARFGPDVRWIDTVDYRFDDRRRAAFARAIQNYYPDLKAEDLEPAYTGIRPKIADSRQPNLDFRIDDARVHGVGGLINLFGIESPGLTASLAIAEAVLAMTDGEQAGGP